MSFQKARGNSSDNGTPVSKPTRVIPPQPNAVSDIRHPIGGGGLGQNQYGGPSSSELDDVPVSGLGANLTASGDPDGTLAAVIHGSKGDDWQTRKVSAEPLPSAHGMHKNTGSPSGIVPPKTGFVENPPVRKP
jgi:hypothetical protein